MSEEITDEIEYWDNEEEVSSQERNSRRTNNLLV